MFSPFKALFRFVWVYREFWMIPAIVLLLLVGGAIVVFQSTTGAPFLYTLF